MDVFDLRNRLVDDYAAYTKSFIKISDKRIDEKVNNALEEGALWPEPLLQLNPTFLPGKTIDELVGENVLHQECSKIFKVGKNESNPIGKNLQLHTHQTEAIHRAKEDKSYILTSGTGSGKSLAYIIPIVDHILRNGSGNGIKAIIVYPMNALANSQIEELNKFIRVGYEDGREPVSFARYTGQEQGNTRIDIRENPPDILLTNYMMLELILTRKEDRKLVKCAQGLKYLVFDELHTYRGRQGADIALLIRRCNLAFNGQDMIHIGTSATMSSGGNRIEQKKDIGKVAKLFFGAELEENQVIDETLERATPEYDFEDPEIIAELKDMVEGNTAIPNNCDEFLKHPLTSWIESTFGVYTEPETAELVRHDPQKLRGAEGVASKLAVMTGTEIIKCYEILRKFLIHGSELKRDDTSAYPIFAFRLHQFFTRGDTVWSTLEAEKERHLELSKQGSKPGEANKLMYPLVFCRQCGKEYYRVSIGEINGKKYVKPREDRPIEEDTDSVDGYLYISTDNPWPEHNETELLSRLPEGLKESAVEGKEKVNPDYKKNLPQNLYIEPSGMQNEAGLGVAASLITKDFLFCLEPGCKVAYIRGRRSEKGKLNTLGVDNRSTATTILAVRSLIELQKDKGLQPAAQKMLSFTDNRQDASLQAGHFNDFTQVALLRSALYKAIAGKGREGLSHADLAPTVFKELGLTFEDYAVDEDVRGPARTATNNEMLQVIEYYLYQDLKRGWRVTAPNLEECGMLEFEYVGLEGDDSLLKDLDLWGNGITKQKDTVVLATPALLKLCNGETLKQIIIELLDMLRRELALKVKVLNPLEQRKLVEDTNARLREDTMWYIEDPADLQKSVVAYPFPKPNRPNDRYGLFISSYGIYGRYLKRTLTPYTESNQKIKREDVDDIIKFLFEALRIYGIVEKVRDVDGPGYQINHDALRWVKGEGKHRPLDKIRLLDEGVLPPAANEYFVECYSKFVELKGYLEAREHTAQVTAADREERETRFRVGSEPGGLPLLFCSPTMELGVDIAQLNLVNLRNVPPTPANYAQRSGRAGRGGQPALVFTYCAGRSPHDQFYYREPNQMVAGVVVTPRLDLRNSDLLQSHVYAVWMEVVKPDLGRTLTTVIDTNIINNLPIKDNMIRILRNDILRARAKSKAIALIEGIKEYIEDAIWYHDDWVDEVLNKIELRFDEACNRWREMYRAALVQRALHHKIIGDHSRPENERNHSRRLRAQAESQIKLLTEAEGFYEGDFYSYRYFASEGFLPGYNFPRLPLSAFIPGRRRRGRDEYVSRPRFLAITEFGPQALIYHEGALYKVYKANLDFGSDEMEATHTLVTANMKRCVHCGYAHIETGSNLVENCDRCNEPLEATINDLIHLQNVSLRLVKRITCDEEERRRFGYKLLTAYRFPERGGMLDRKDAEVLVNGNTVIRLNYGDAATLYRINMGWAKQTNDENPGFLLDLERGYWGVNPADQEDANINVVGKQLRVVPYVIDTKNALTMKFLQTQDKAMLSSLQAAFKEAIQKKYQLEPRELAVELLPNAMEPKELLYYEAAEGGAGILRQLVEDAKAIPELARVALEICHFNPDTLEDLEAATCGKACYRCLLDYSNQRSHHLLDRHQIKELLAEISSAECKPSGGLGSRQERLVGLYKKCESKLEEKWLKMIDELGLQLPSDAQLLIEACSTRPDFYYSKDKIAVYIDGPPHDELDAKRADEVINSKLIDSGYGVIRFHHSGYSAGWQETFKKHADVFGEAKHAK